MSSSTSFVNKDDFSSSQTFRSFRNRWTSSPISIVKKVSLVSIPALALLFLYNLPTAEAGPFTYSGCVVACEAVAAVSAAASGGVLLPAAAAALVACARGCLPLLAVGP